MGTQSNTLDTKLIIYTVQSHFLSACNTYGHSCHWAWGLHHPQADALFLSLPISQPALLDQHLLNCVGWCSTGMNKNTLSFLLPYNSRTGQILLQIQCNEEILKLIYLHSPSQCRWMLTDHRVIEQLRLERTSRDL